MSFRTVYGFTHSESGWRMVNRDGCVVTNPVPFSDTAPVRAGDAATILNAWLVYYHRNVEPIISPVWGWSATNDVRDSNHLSGTAVDINAPKYPFGTFRMPPEIVRRVEEGLRLFEGTVFWGRRWSYPDEMHYQLGLPESDARISRFAARLTAGYLGLDRPVGTGLTAETLSAAMGGSVPMARYRELVPAVSQALIACRCTTVDRAAMWSAQIGHESLGLRHFEEIWGPTPAQAGYEGRADLGNVEPGDGHRFRGRGPLMVTGRGHYATLSRWAYDRGMVPSPTFFVDHPDQLAGVEYGFVGVVWYWTAARPQLNALADRRDLEGATRAINGGLNGLADRRTRYQRCLGLGEAILPGEEVLDMATVNDILAKLDAIDQRLQRVEHQLGPTQPGWGPDSSFGTNEHGEEYTLRDGLAVNLRTIDGRLTRIESSLDGDGGRSGASSA